MTDFLAAVAAEFQIIVRDRAGLPGGRMMG